MATQGWKWMGEMQVSLLSECYLFIYSGANGKSVREEWMKWGTERVVRWEGKGEDSNIGKRKSVLNYWLHIYTLAWLLCIAFCICQDYPSVAHIAEALRKKNIQIIFAVTEEVTHLYEVDMVSFNFLLIKGFS